MVALFRLDSDRLVLNLMASQIRTYYGDCNHIMVVRIASWSSVSQCDRKNNQDLKILEIFFRFKNNVFLMTFENFQIFSNSYGKSSTARSRAPECLEHKFEALSDEDLHTQAPKLVLDNEKQLLF